MTDTTMINIDAALRSRGLPVHARTQVQAAMHVSKPVRDHMQKMHDLRLDPDLLEKTPQGLVYHGDVYWAGLGLKQLPDLLWKVDGDVDCSNNHLTSLKNLPEHIQGDLRCAGNNLPKDTEKPRGVRGKFVCCAEPPPRKYSGQHHTTIDPKTAVRLEKQPAPAVKHGDHYGRAEAAAEPPTYHDDATTAGVLFDFFAKPQKRTLSVRGNTLVFSGTTAGNFIARVTVQESRRTYRFQPIYSKDSSGYTGVILMDVLDAGGAYLERDLNRKFPLAGVKSQRDVTVALARIVLAADAAAGPRVVPTRKPRRTLEEWVAERGVS